MTTNSTDERPYLELAPEEYNDIASRILYEDNHLLIFNKRSGEIVQGDKTNDEPLPQTLKRFIAARDSKPSRVFLGVTHRLDRPVSGIVVFAKTSKGLERMNELFRNGGVRKYYRALTEKEPRPEKGSIRSFLVRNEKQNKTYSHPAPVPGAKEAILNYKLIEKTEKYYLVEVELLTGRHHQIRCQLASIGCTIKGDLKYGAKRSNRDGSISLQSHRITFEHPIKHIPIEITAPCTISELAGNQHRHAGY